MGFYVKERDVILVENLTIRNKLYVVFGVLIAIFVATSIFAGYSLNSINEGALRISTDHMRGAMVAADSSQAMSDYRQTEYAVLTAPTLPSRIYAIQSAEKLNSQMEITFKNVEPTLSGEALTDFQEMKTIWEKYIKESKEMFALVEAGNTAEATNMLARSELAYQQITYKLSQLVDNRKDFIHQENVAVAGHFNTTMVTMTVANVLVLALSVFMAMYLSKTIHKSIGYLMNVSREVASGNLTVDVVPQTNDEFGELTASYRDTVVNLRGLITQIHSTAEEVSSFAAQLTENAGQSAQATQQVAESIGNVAAATNMQGDNVTTSVNEIQSMSDSIKGFEYKASASSNAAKNVEGIAKEGKNAIAGAVKQMDEIAQSVMEASNVIKQLAERSEEIGQISDTIAGIAGETNLLSLNAAIEAARAGEAGRGFAVVSEEVRKLAEESATASQKIAELIRRIQEETDQAVVRMEHGTEVVKNGQIVMDDAGRAFENISTAVSDLTAHAEGILKDARMSTQKANHLVNVMEALDESGRSVSAETESVSAATEEQAASMDEIANASSQLANLSHDLQAATSKFKI